MSTTFLSSKECLPEPLGSAIQRLIPLLGAQHATARSGNNEGDDAGRKIPVSFRVGGQHKGGRQESEKMTEGIVEGNRVRIEIEGN